MKKLFALLTVAIMTVGVMAETVYFVNKAGYANPHCYAWTGGTNNGAWPGVKMTKENYQLAGADVYSYTATTAYENCIFNDGGQSQTADLTWNGNKYFDGTSWKTRAELEGNQGGGGGQGQGGGQTGEGNPRYYWKGHVDGQDVEPDASTMFEDGVSAISVAADAYLFVLYQVDGFPGVQYMTASYVDGPTHATLLTNGGEKFHLTAGDHDLYLYDNGNGTLELSTEVLPGKTLVGGGQAQGFEQVRAQKTVNKSLVNGQMVITVDGVRYNTNGVRL